MRWALYHPGDSAREGRRMEAAKALGVSYPTFLKRLDEPDELD